MKFYTKRSGNLRENLYKFLLVMRLTLILLIAGMMQVSAGTYGQQITLSQNNITIKQVFKTIKVQTGYDVLWQPDKLDAEQKINAHFNKTPLAIVIKECISGHDLEFEIQDKSIVLKAIMRTKIFPVQQDSVVFKGRVTDENGKGMSGATIKISGSSRTTFTNAQGNFAIYGPLKGNIEVTYVGYMGKQLTLNGLNPTKQISITLVPGNNNLGEVNVVSTGYQDIPKERATGSFEVITKEQLQHSSDPNLIRRLEGITTSMNFNNQLTPINSATAGYVGIAGQYQKSPLANLTIRGRNTLAPGNSSDNTSGQVLIIIDGVASPYSIDQIDPNDVENITVLKDAAAASIWGARASNGVIVVKTKHGNYERPLRISFNNSFNVTDKLNLFYKNYMSTSDYIDGQIFQFNKSNTAIGAPNLSQPQPLYSPVAEILEKQRIGQLTADQAKSQIDVLRGNDVRRDFDKYVLRDALTQNYSLSLDGGSKMISYRLSAAYTNIFNNTIASGSNRLALNYSTSVKPLKNLELQANISYAQQQSNDQDQTNLISTNVSAPYYLYTRLVDDQGAPVSIPYKYRPVFLDLLSSTYGSKILDERFYPLQDINEGYTNTNSKNLNFNIGANYKLDQIFSVNVLYNYNRGYSQQTTLSRPNSFYMRDLINLFTTPDLSTRQIPYGGFYRPTLRQSSNQTLRGQLNANKSWSDKHVISVIAGIDVTQNYVLTTANQYYGYNENTLRSTTQLDYSNQLTTLFNNDTGSPTSRISYTSGYTDYRVRTYSFFSNGAYTYNRTYTISGSVRKDASSEFGPGTNKTGTPYYSIGSSWNIANEKFYQSSFLPHLQLRATFGYNGNTNPQVISQPLITYSSGPGNNGLNYATTGPTSATNSQLRPEKTAIINLGIDFGFRNNRISGNVEYYDKRTTDLIAPNKVDPSTGFASLTFNTGSLRTKGWDLTVNSQNLQSGLFSWTSTFLFSYNRVKVSKLYTPAPRTAGDLINGVPAYDEGYDLSRIFAYRWAGLDPITGDPRGYLNGQIVTLTPAAAPTIYTNMYFSPLSNVRYMGSAAPVYSGSLRNTFSYGSFSLSVNMLYKLGYYFRRPGADMVGYSNFFSYGFLQGAEYSQRWQKPGDELITNVPSLSYPGSTSRDSFYQYADINVLKADHLRLQEINLAYSFGRKNWFIKNPRIYANISNLGVIWRANKLGLDPDIYDYPNPRTYAFGFSANF